MTAMLELDRLQLTIGSVAKLAGCSPSWLRQLEDLGAIPEAERTVTGRRVYRLADVENIRRVVAGGRENVPATAAVSAA